MASSIVHLAITDKLTKSRTFNAPDRLRFGSVIVDAGLGNSHMKIRVSNGTKKTYDLNSFRSMFGHLITEDDLYLGYYLHLVQDALFRHFVYDRYKWDPLPQGNVDRLHNDYSVVNRYIIEEYGLTNDLSVPFGFDKEQINKICTFDTEGFIWNMDGYFSSVQDGEIFFFTQAMSDEFIYEAVDFCTKETEIILNGGCGMDMYEWAWN